MREPLDSGGELIRAAAVIRRAGGAATGVVVGSVRLTGDMAVRARRMLCDFYAPWLERAAA
jgi:hypothetical protein